MTRLGGGRASAVASSVRLLAAAVMVAALAAACGEDEPPPEPALPPGFAEAPLPDVAVDLYAFAAPQRPLTLPTSYFIDGISLASSVIPGFIEVDEAATWSGPTPGSFGASLRFTDEAMASLIGSYLEESDGPWHELDGDSLTLVRGDGTWARQARQAVDLNLGAPISTKYPDVWDLMQNLPADPPEPPVAAGFTRLDGGLIDSLGELVGASGPGITSALRTARVTDLVFALYQETPPAVTDSVDADYMTETGTVALVVTKSGYPGFVVGMGIGVFAGQAGLEEIELGEATAYYIGWGSLHIVLRQRGGVLFVALAGSRDRAEAVMATVPE